MSSLSNSLAVLLASSLLATNLSARGNWSVVSPENLDARLVRQLQELAHGSHAKIRFVREAAEVPRRGRALILELDEAKNIDSFIAIFKRLVNKPEPTAELAREGYVLETSYAPRASPNRIVITAATPEGFHNALFRIPALVRARPSNLSSTLVPAAKSVRIEQTAATVPLGAGPPRAPARRGTTVPTLAERRNIIGNEKAVVADFPSFPERGIVEGFYGKPWSHKDRLEMLDFEGAHAMNVYYYAPKDDPYHRKLWRDPYPPAPMQKLGELAARARSNFVNFCFAISPGLSMVYSSQEDHSKLVAKLRSIGRLGVSCFALFLDDVPQELQDPHDKARFKTLAAAHVDLINWLYRQLKAQSADNRLVVTPTTYTNEWGSRDYIRELGAGVEPDVPLVWTGIEVVPPTITAAQAREWGELLRRKPLIWDNFPANDGIAWRLNLGPMRGRDPDLPEVVRGLFSNPMNQARASMIPLQTVAEYLWNSSAYDADAARRRAVIEQYGADAPRRLAAFLAAYGDYWWDENIFEPLYVARRENIDMARIRRRLGELSSTARSLRWRGHYRKLAKEISPFAARTRARVAEVLKDPAFSHLPGQQIRWHEDFDVLTASRIAAPFSLDGDFAKWESGTVYTLDRKAQISTGPHLWRGPGQLSARFALAWDEQYLYIGVDVTDPDLYQPFTGRDIPKGDLVAMTLETAFRKNFTATRADGDEYHMLFSPGNFAGVEPAVYSEEEYFPPRPHPRDYAHETRAAWKKTTSGFSGDIALPVSWFEGGRFRSGYEIGLGFAAQKAFPLPAGSLGGDEDVPRIVFRSKNDKLFPVHFGNPSSYQRLIFTERRGK